MSKGKSSRLVHVEHLQEDGAFVVHLKPRRMDHLKLLCRATGLKAADYIMEMIEVGFVRTDDIANVVLGVALKTQPLPQDPPPQPGKHRSRDILENEATRVWEACLAMETFRVRDVRKLVPEVGQFRVATLLERLLRKGALVLVSKGGCGTGNLYALKKAVAA